MKPLFVVADVSRAARSASQLAPLPNRSLCHGLVSVSIPIAEERHGLRFLLIQHSSNSSPNQPILAGLDRVLVPFA